MKSTPLGLPQPPRSIRAIGGFPTAGENSPVDPSVQIVGRRRRRCPKGGTLNIDRYNTDAGFL